MLWSTICYQLALTEGRGSLNIDASVIAKTNSTGGIDLGRLAYDAKFRPRMFRRSISFQNRICMLLVVI